MASDAVPAETQRTFHVILSAALMQGWALYGLHLSVEGKAWPATDPAWLFALYAAALFVPITVQILAEHIRDRIVWWSSGGVFAAFCYFGWHHGAHEVDQVPSMALLADAVPQFFVLGLLWLLALPFLQCRLLEGGWRPNYRTLFAAAWRNKLTLGEAGVFTGLFWLLLVLWAGLFKMLDIDFFAKLFVKAIFIYPVTALVFGSALSLIGSLARLVTVVLEQVLNVLKWLAVIAGLILALFTIALTAKLPNLVETGARAIGAAWLLGLTAVMVLLVNAAYRDGQVERPYPRWLGVGQRAVLPLLVIIVLTACYAMYLRIDAHGLTVSRFWGCVVAAAGCIYAAGYAYAAVRGTPWMAGIERINIVAALFLIGVIALALTPVLSPYRLAANSQAERALQPLATTEAGYHRNTPFEYLRFSTGSYGRARLIELTSLQDHPRAEEINSAARLALASKGRSYESEKVDPRPALAAMPIYPEMRSLEPELLATMAADLEVWNDELHFNRSEVALHGLYLDMNDDGIEEFVLLAPSQGVLYTRSASARWSKVGKMQSIAETVDLRAAIKAGQVKTTLPRWRELEVGNSRFRIGDPGN
jgi:hypothetical protein